MDLNDRNRYKHWPSPPQRALKWRDHPQAPAPGFEPTLQWEVGRKSGMFRSRNPPSLLGPWLSSSGDSLTHSRPWKAASAFKQWMVLKAANLSLISVSHCANRQETSHLYLPSKSLRISEQAGMPSCPCSAPKSPLVGWSLCPSLPSLSRIASLTHFWFRWGHPLPGHLAVWAQVSWAPWESSLKPLPWRGTRGGSG